MFPIGDTIPSRNPPITTWLLILANCTVFLFELMMSEPELVRFFHLFGIIPVRFANPDSAVWSSFPIEHYWPFFTSMFLHGGWLHIIGNMWTLWIFGDNVEDRMGPIRFLAFYLLCGLAAGIVHLLTNPLSTIPTVGASGAIAGVLGAYFYLFPSSRVIVIFPTLVLPLFLYLPAVVYLGIWAFTQFFAGALSLASEQDVGGVAWWAHVGGFVAGVFSHFAFVRRRGDYRPASRDEYAQEGAWLPERHWRES